MTFLFPSKEEQDLLREVMVKIVQKKLEDALEHLTLAIFLPVKSLRQNIQWYLDVKVRSL